MTQEFVDMGNVVLAAACFFGLVILVITWFGGDE